MPEIKFKYRLQIKRKVCYNGIHQGDISQGGAEAMRKSKLLGAVLLSACLSLGSVVPAMADGMKVVTLGADLTEAQKQTMMKYFKTSADEVQILTITNQDERDHLSSYVPLEQIGTRTVSCAYVKPTQSGGIRVRTANLNWVTGNMIATTLSTSGVKNCEVVAACPFEVSGTGALTGIQMAYEAASGEKLDETKKEIATEEMVVTGNLADQVGKNDATTVINQAKMEVIQNNVQDANESYNMVFNIAQQNNVTVDSEQMDKIVSLLEQIAQQNYNYEDMQETLERVEENVSGEVSEETESETDVVDQDSILSDVDESILGEDVPTSSTEEPVEEETMTEEDPEATVEPETNEDGVVEEIPGEEGTEGETVPEEGTGEAALSEQAQSQYDAVKEFCTGEYEGNTEMGEGFTPSAVLDAETGALLSQKVEETYYQILTEGTGSYIPTGMEQYISVELNMMNEKLKEIFNIEQPEKTEEEAAADILADVAQEDRELLYHDTLKFFENLYGETTFTDETAENGEATEEPAEQTTEGTEEIPEGTEETYPTE